MVVSLGVVNWRVQKMLRSVMGLDRRLFQERVLSLGVVNKRVQNVDDGEKVIF